ncbi:MAG TPA: YraN family protein [Candidatus Saccharimonadales bacterium]|nr:YraN family protein [Candidatus Saccharimonadales bacterium]
MTNYTAGHNAEKYAADYLKKLGYQILDLNWKTRYCEIDIIAQKNQTIHFIEVKYRSGNRQGLGLDYITTKKQAKMNYSAELWVNHHHWAGEYVLSAIEISGQDFDSINFIEVI